MKLQINIVDAFTKKRFKGNPAAVIISKKWLKNSLMQSIATENNLSETAFLVADKNGTYHIRWFSPITEIDFCGHATLASAFVIFKNNPKQNKVKFLAKSVGEMIIKRSKNGYIHMNFPNQKPTAIKNIPKELLKGLSIKPTSVLRNNQAYFAIYKSENDVTKVKQQKKYLKKLAPYDVVVTAKGKKYDFVSRYFWPANGGNEDPVTGSIHTGLAPFWSEKLGKSKLIGYQASKRGGILLCKVKKNRVTISGKAVHYLKGYIKV